MNKNWYTFLILLFFVSFCVSCSSNSYTNAQEAYDRMYAKSADEKTVQSFPEFLESRSYVGGGTSAITAVTDFSLDYQDLHMNFLHFHNDPDKDNGEMTEFQFFRELKDSNDAYRKFYGVTGMTLPSGEKAYIYAPFFQAAVLDMSGDVTGYGAVTNGDPILYSCKELCYADFSGIGIGSSISEITQIDPTTILKEKPHRERAEAGIDFTVFSTFHLLTDGILEIRYAFEGTEPLVTHMELYGDYDTHVLTNFGIGMFYVDPADRPLSDSPESAAG